MTRVDDFGACSFRLSYLTDPGADDLEIDNVFVDAIRINSVTSEVVLHIIQTAKSLNLTIISESAETQTQAFLRARCVIYAQGSLFSRAMPRGG